MPAVNAPTESCGEFRRYRQGLRAGANRRRLEMRYRKTMGYLAALSCTCVCVAGAAFAQEEEPVLRISNNLDTAYLSKYVWRGVVLNPDPVVQPSLTFTLPSGFSYNLWMSMNTEDNAVAGDADLVVEQDHTVSYLFTFAGREMSLGYIYYAFPNTSLASTQEFFGTVGFGGKFSPAISINYDSDEVRGAYIALSAGYSTVLPVGSDSGIPMDLTAKLGYGTASYIKRAYPGAPDKAAPLDLVVGVSSTIPWSGKYSITPSVSYSTILDGDVSDAVSEPDNFVAGVTFGVAF